MTLTVKQARVYVNKPGTHTIVKASYNPQLVEAIRVIPGARWNREKEFWSMPADSLEAANAAVRPYYQVEGEESQVQWVERRLRVTFDQHRSPSGQRKRGKAVLIDGSDLLNAGYGNTIGSSSEFDILSEQGGFTDGDAKAAYWTVEYTLVVKMRANARIEAMGGTCEVIG